MLNATYSACLEHWSQATEGVAPRLCYQEYFHPINFKYIAEQAARLAAAGEEQEKEWEGDDEETEQEPRWSSG